MLQYCIQSLINISFGLIISYLSFFRLLQETSWRKFDFIVFFFGIFWAVVSLINFQNTINYYLQIKKKEKEKPNNIVNFPPPDDTVNP